MNAHEIKDLIHSVFEKSIVCAGVLDNLNINIIDNPTNRGDARVVDLPEEFEVAARLHGCSKLRYKTLGTFLTSRGVDLTPGGSVQSIPVTSLADLPVADAEVVVDINHPAIGELATTAAVVVRQPSVAVRLAV